MLVGFLVLGFFWFFFCLLGDFFVLVVFFAGLFVGWLVGFFVGFLVPSDFLYLIECWFLIDLLFLVDLMFACRLFAC